MSEQNLETIVGMWGDPGVLNRLNEMGVCVGSVVYQISPGIWKVDGTFTVALRLSSVEIELDKS